VIKLEMGEKETCKHSVLTDISINFATIKPKNVKFYGCHPTIKYLMEKADHYVPTNLELFLTNNKTSSGWIVLLLACLQKDGMRKSCVGKA
jgi:hypothetical protein